MKGGKDRCRRPLTRAAATHLAAVLFVAVIFGVCARGVDFVHKPALTDSVTAADERHVAPPMPRSRPIRLHIPAIGLDSRLMKLGLQKNGTLEVPPDGFPAGWFTGAPTPGSLGPAVVVGHVHWQRRDGVFADLAKITRDDEVSVDRADGSVAVFRVTRVVQVAKSTFPTEQVYGNIKTAGLRLITCGGLDPSTREYDDSIIVFARLVSSHMR